MTTQLHRFAAAALLDFIFSYEKTGSSRNSALMSARGDLTEKKIYRFASESGLDIEALRRRMADNDIEEALVRNFKLAEELGIEGTPAFVIGRNLVPGAADAKTLRQLVLATREECQKAETC